MFIIFFKTSHELHLFSHLYFSQSIVHTAECLVRKADSINAIFIGSKIQFTQNVS